MLLEPKNNSENEELDFLQKRIETLKTDNDKLRQQLTLLEGIYDFHANKIASKAQDDFTLWFRNSAIGITVALFVGGLGLSNLIIESIKTESVKGILSGNGSQELREKIVEKALQDLKPQIQATVNKVTQETVRSAVTEVVAKADLEVRIRAEVDSAFTKVANQIKAQNPSNEFVQGVESSIAEIKYFVVAGSSSNLADLEGARQEVKNANGGNLPAGIESVKICPPLAGNQRYALVIGKPVSLEQAKQLVKLATDNNFQADTYPIRTSDAFFKYDSSCN